jgi:ribonucleoside-diphosphate reductase alpha chain
MKHLKYVTWWLPLPCFHKEEPNTARMRYIKEYYNAASDGLFTLATPVLAGLGTPTKQFSSCVLIRVPMTIWTLYLLQEK